MPKKKLEASNFHDKVLPHLTDEFQPTSKIAIVSHLGFYFCERILQDLLDKQLIEHSIKGHSSHQWRKLQTQQGREAVSGETAVTSDTGKSRQDDSNVELPSPLVENGIEVTEECNSEVSSAVQSQDLQPSTNLGESSDDIHAEEEPSNKGLEDTLPQPQHEN